LAGIARAALRDRLAHERVELLAPFEVAPPRRVVPRLQALREDDDRRKPFEERREQTARPLSIEAATTEHGLDDHVERDGLPDVRHLHAVALRELREMSARDILPRLRKALHALTVEARVQELARLSMRRTCGREERLRAEHVAERAGKNV